MAESSLLKGDARNLRRIARKLASKPRSVITSPPYWNVNDYGHKSQIGYGQSLSKYLNAMGKVFSTCFDITTEDATLWLVTAPVYRSEGLIPLPELLTKLATKAGWIPREQITWAKMKSLPWARHGQLRHITEQATLLSKADSYLFRIETLLSPYPASQWWIKYPERYSPYGWRPTNLWEIPIPTQGSWYEDFGHVCPFPQELTFRLISLTTERGDTVIDPFAGIGSVPAMANAMSRKGYGIELNEEYVSLYSKTQARAVEWFKYKQKEMEATKMSLQLFKKTILELRALKYAALLSKEAIQNNLGVAWIHTSQPLEGSDRRNKVARATFTASVLNGSSTEAVQFLFERLAKQKPLSKFGIEPTFQTQSKESQVETTYWYPDGAFWKEPRTLRIVGDEIPITAPFRPSINAIQEMEPPPEELNATDFLSDEEFTDA